MRLSIAIEYYNLVMFHLKPTSPVSAIVILVYSKLNIQICGWPDQLGINSDNNYINSYHVWFNEFSTHTLVFL